jgi:hypothetical protein
VCSSLRSTLCQFGTTPYPTTNRGAYGARLSTPKPAGTPSTVRAADPRKPIRRNGCGGETMTGRYPAKWPRKDWGSRGRRFKSGQPDQADSLVVKGDPFLLDVVTLPRALVGSPAPWSRVTPLHRTERRTGGDYRVRHPRPDRRSGRRGEAAAEPSQQRRRSTGRSGAGWVRSKPSWTSAGIC